MASIEEEFERAFDYVQGLPKYGPYKLSSDSKLIFHGYYMQATKGECKLSCPSLLSGGKAKWEAWHKLGKMSKQSAMTFYVNEVKKLKADFADAAGRQGSRF